ncbi:MAG: PT domain-containing protein, partial [Actinomycetia bacterium]|nr:PT domain-containing protein [Actinomycetes bacterium]
DQPSDEPTDQPSDEPTDQPSDEPTDQPSDEPSDEPGDKPNDSGNGQDDQPADEGTPNIQAINFPQREQQIAAPAVSSSDSSSLARTGSDATWTALLTGVLALGTGVVIIVAARRRPTTDQ